MAIGPTPNTIPLVEKETRWDCAAPAFAHGIPESLSIDQSKHSLFGASKAAADVGGGKENSCSILEACAVAEQLAGRK